MDLDKWLKIFPVIISICALPVSIIALIVSYRTQKAINKTQLQIKISDEVYEVRTKINRAIHQTSSNIVGKELLIKKYNECLLYLDELYNECTNLGYAIPKDLLRLKQAIESHQEIFKQYNIEGDEGIKTELKKYDKLLNEGIIQNKTNDLDYIKMLSKLKTMIQTTLERAEHENIILDETEANFNPLYFKMIAKDAFLLNPTDREPSF